MPFWKYSRNLNLTSVIYISLLSTFVYFILAWPTGSVTLIQDYGLFFFLGLAGALVANSTGAGGGVIFIPFFTLLDFTSAQSIATSIAIQCFGMTAGTVSWSRFIHKKMITKEINPYPVIKIVSLTGPTTIIAVLIGQYVLPHPKINIETLFGLFSIIFGITLLIFTKIKGKNDLGEIHPTTRFSEILMIATCFVGGIVTTWISVGVGEAIALLLFFLGYPAFFAVAIGVFTSSISVLTAISYHIQADNVSTEVLLFAGMAALVGGYVARYITNKIGGYNLKIFFGFWILISGFFTL